MASCQDLKVMEQHYNRLIEEKSPYLISQTDLSDETVFELMKLLFECIDQKHLPQEIIPILIGVPERRVTAVFKKYKFN